MHSVMVSSNPGGFPCSGPLGLVVQPGLVLVVCLWAAGHGGLGQVVGIPAVWCAGRASAKCCLRVSWSLRDGYCWRPFIRRLRNQLSRSFHHAVRVLGAGSFLVRVRGWEQQALQLFGGLLGAFGVVLEVQPGLERVHAGYTFDGLHVLPDGVVVGDGEPGVGAPGLWSDAQVLEGVDVGDVGYISCGGAVSGVVGVEPCGRQGGEGVLDAGLVQLLVQVVGVLHRVLGGEVTPDGLLLVEVVLLPPALHEGPWVGYREAPGGAFHQVGCG